MGHLDGLGRIARAHPDGQAFRRDLIRTAIPWCALDHHHQTPPPALRTMCPVESRMLAHAPSLIQSARKRQQAAPNSRLPTLSFSEGGIFLFFDGCPASLSGY